ncbi:MAG: 16S rRNA (guanine(966)-N(2))-methyltransferase RsmD [Coriobacteriia bacterium]
MRLIAGALGGRRIRAPGGTATRPTSDRVREAVFSALETLNAFHGASVLDAFAGSGAMGLEALSRGAGSVTFVDSSARAAAVVRANIDSLGVGDSATLRSGDAIALAGRAALPGAPFSLLFLDPPYKLDKFKVRRLIESLIESGGLAADALVVWEHATSTAVEWPDAISPVREKRYGDTTVSIARYEEGEVR